MYPRPIFDVLTFPGSPQVYESCFRTLVQKESSACRERGELLEVMRRHYSTLLEVRPMKGHHARKTPLCAVCMAGAGDTLMAQVDVFVAPASLVWRVVHCGSPHRLRWVHSVGGTDVFSVRLLNILS